MPEWLLGADGKPWVEPAEAREAQLHRPLNVCTPAPLGSGPEGETCGSCGHKTTTQGWTAKPYTKCRVMMHEWTHGGGTDIKCRWHACQRWVPKGTPPARDSVRGWRDWQAEPEPEVPNASDLRECHHVTQGDWPRTLEE